MADSKRPKLTSIELGADHASWAGAGFTVADSRAHIGSVSIEFTASVHGVASLGFDWLPAGCESLDGIALRTAPAVAPAGHSNGVVSIDQVVIATPDFERTAAALEELGLPIRREALRKADDDIGTDVRQGFVRAGGPVLELVNTEAVPPGPAHVWGLGFITERFDEALEELDGVIGKPRPAVQPGRRIATFVRDAGLGLPVVLLDPEPTPDEVGEPPGSVERGSPHDAAG